MATIERRGIGLSAAVGLAVRSYLEDIAILLPVNVAWALLVGVALVVGAIVPALLLLAPLIALPTAAFMRLAVASVHEDKPTWRHLVGELRRTPSRKVLVAAGQLLATLVAIANIGFGASLGGIFGAVIAMVSIYVVVLVWVGAAVLWPILSDPALEQPLARQMRLAALVVLARPLPVLGLALLSVVAAYVSVQLIAPSFFLPSILFLFIAWYVIPHVERISLEASP